jgi:hypothetical protein
MKNLAEKFGLSFLEDLSECQLVQQRAAIIPYSLAKQKKIIPVEETANEWVVALSNPIDL